jgi:hypothetical protein
MSMPERKHDPAEDSSSGDADPRRPDWLVGAEDAASEEFERIVQARPGDVTSRPVQLSSLADECVASDPGPDRKPEPAAPAAPVAWTAAASSIPTLPRRAPSTDRPRVEPPPAAAGAIDEDESEAGFDLETAPDGHALAPPAAALKPLHEPWWMVLLDEVRTRRKVQIIVAAATLGVSALTFALWPRGAAGVPLAKIRHNPAAYDGQSVVVRGKIGEVYSVGGGYAFYLLQGRDTIVTFTRSRVPEPRQNVVIQGQITTGFLDGEPRQALFENPSP